MLGLYASAALICAASLLVGRAVITVAGRQGWTWLEPAVGLAAILTVTGICSRAPGRSTTATVCVVVLLIVAAVVVARSKRPSPGALREAVPVVIAVGLVLSIPFAIAGRWGFLGVGFNNDLGLHLAWAEWLRSGFGPIPEAGYPLGPHALADVVATFPGISLGQAFTGLIFAIGVLTALTALGALRGLGPRRRVLAAVLVSVPYLAASFYAQGTFKETAEALFVFATAIGLAGIDRARLAGVAILPDLGAPAVKWLRTALPFLALAGGTFFSYSFAGLAWPIAVVALWSLTLAPVRGLFAPRSLLRFLFRPVTLITIAVLGCVAIVATLVGPFGFAAGFNKVAGSNTYGPVSPVEVLGIWWTPNYRLNAPGSADLPILAGAISGAAFALGLIWWLRRRELAIPIALGACTILYLGAMPFSGHYSLAKALMIGAPLAMLIAIRPLLAEFPLGRSAGGEAETEAGGEASGTRGLTPTRTAARVAWAVLAIAFVGGASYSSFLALRDAPVGPPGHGAELRSFLPILHGQPVIYAGQDRYAAHALLGADAHVPLVEFPAPGVEPNTQKPFDTGDAYSPLDFDSFSVETLDRFPYVITGRSAWNSEAPANFRRIAATPSFILWERTGPTDEGRRTLIEGTDAASWADCASPEIRILLEGRGRASLFPAAVIGRKVNWDGGRVLTTGARTSQTLDLPAGRWNLSLQYFSPYALTLSAPGFSEELIPALDGQRPNTISLANDGQFWPAGQFESKGGPVEFTIEAAEPNTLQRLSGYSANAYLGSLVAVAAGKRQAVPLSQACDSWIDWYEVAGP